MDVNKLLHPDLLSQFEILQILESLCVKVSPDLPRNQLLEIYKKVALPLPQRNPKNETHCSFNGNHDGMDSCPLLFSHNRRNEHQNTNHSKKFKFENAKDVTSIESQLESVQLCEKSVISHNTFQNAIVKSNTRKIILKRAHLFKKDESDVDKRIKLC